MRPDPVVYQIYPRSFQDSNGDGIGDLAGVRARLDHVRALGADAIWLSPVHPSPNADWGYDVADYDGIHPDLGIMADWDALVDAAHARGLAVLMDLVPGHTSIAHPWFRERPELYVWREAPPNNWRSAFGGPAWTRDPESGRYYLHSFYAEQADLDWGNRAVAQALAGVVRVWRERGVDGFRLDALQQLVKDPRLRDDPPARGPAPLPVHPELAGLELVHSRGAANTDAIRTALAALRAAAGEHAFLVGEVYLPSDRLAPYLPALDAVFAFELLHAPPEPGAIRAAIAGAQGTGKPAWVVSNHDFPRLPNRWGRANVRATALLLLTLPGPVFVYQGDEIGMADGPAADPPRDRAGRDAFRTPMHWDATPGAGFTTGTPWIPLGPDRDPNVAAQQADGGSLLRLYRDLIALRRELAGPLELRAAAPELVCFDRDGHRVAINFTGLAAPAPPHGRILLSAGGYRGIRGRSLRIPAG